jgi:aryl-phospho-beta-D-glucosidase BglC (GH1 family)
MKNSLPKILAVLVFAIAAQTMTAQAPKVHEWWHDTWPGGEYKGTDAKKLPQISVSGNHFADPQGKTVLFRGLNISDPDKIAKQGHWNRELFVKIHEMGATLVRIPVHPVAWRERGVENYLAMLDQAAAWSAEQGIYLDIDWHSIGNLKAGLFQDPMYVTSEAETLQFWRTIAHHFAGVNTIAFAEIFNEPTTYNDQLGAVSWHDWKLFNEQAITVIRANGMQAIPLVAGFDWAYDLTPLRQEPIALPGVAYVTHPYPNKRSRPYQPKWDEDFGFAAWQHPVIATEWGFVDGKGGMADNGAYGNELIPYLESRGISWTAWVLDPEWGPSMIKSWDTFELTEQGQFVVDAMKGKVPAK